MAPAPQTDPALEALLLRFPARELLFCLRRNLTVAHVEQPARLQMAAQMLGLGAHPWNWRQFYRNPQKAVARYQRLNPEVDLATIEELEGAPGREQEGYRAAVGMLRLLADE